MAENEENEVDYFILEDEIKELAEQADFWGIESLTEDQQLLLGFT